MRLTARCFFLASLALSTSSLAQGGSIPQMNGIIGAEQTMLVGEAGVVESPSPVRDVAVVFEDDGDTGYFYAVDQSGGGLAILDASHIYDVADVVDRKPSKVSILWSADGLKSALLINGVPHAVFDFASRRSYCRTNFPPPNDVWPQPSREWSDAVYDLFK